MVGPSMQVVFDWQEAAKAQGLSQSTIRQYSACLVRFLLDARIPDLLGATEADAVAYIARLSDRGPTRQLHMKALRSFYRWALETGRIPEDPTRKLRPKAPPSPPVDAFSEDEVMRLVATARARHPKRGWAILAAYGLGLRRRELCQLAPADVDFDRRRVYIRQSKGGRSRWVPMSRVAEGALQGLRPWWGSSVVGDINPNTFTVWVNQAATDAGFPPGRRRAHMLRSGFATELRRRGVNRIEIVQQLLGHATIATTQRYMRVDAEELRTAVGLL